MKFLLLISFFYNFLSGDVPITVDTLEGYDAVQYYFFTNFLTYRYLFDIQIILRFQLKTEFSYTDFLSPLELLYLYQRAEDIEKEKEDKVKNTSYT